LLEMTPGARLKVTARVWNPSPRKLPRGLLRLHAAEGWLCDENERRVGSIKPFESREVRFEVTAPALCAARSLRPLVFKYEADEIRSTPCTELVWWTPADEE